MESLFTNIIVDETASSKENHCDDAMIYITDTVAPGMQATNWQKWQLASN